jgi:hypothetical protein
MTSVFASPALRWHRRPELRTVVASAGAAFLLAIFFFGPRHWLWCLAGAPLDDVISIQPDSTARMETEEPEGLTSLSRKPAASFTSPRYGRRVDDRLAAVLRGHEAGVGVTQPDNVLPIGIEDHAVLGQSILAPS